MNKVVSEVENIQWIKDGKNIQVEGYIYIEGINIDTNRKVTKSAILSNGDRKIVLPVMNIFRNDKTISNEFNNYDYCGFEFSFDASFIDNMQPLSDGKWYIEMYINVDGNEYVENLIASDLFCNLPEKIINHTKFNKIYKICSNIDNEKKIYIDSCSQYINFMKFKVFKHNMKSKIIKSKYFIKVKDMLIKILYKVFSKLPIKENGVVFLTNIGSMTGNFRCVYEELNKKGIYDIKCMCKEHKDDKKTIIENIKVLYYLARYKTIFLDAHYGILEKISMRRGINIVQLWHAPGAFKKFGFSRKGKARFKNIERKIGNRQYTHVIVSSANLKNQYAEAFRVPYENIISTGVPRTDVFFNDDYIKNRVEDLYKKYPILKNKKIILFAPTYRGKDFYGYYNFDKLNIESLKNELGKEYIFVMKLHNHIKNKPKWNDKYNDFIIDLSHEKEINDLFFISDLMITDYSSVVFEYSLLRRPMIFFAYDLEDYISDRDFYYPYESFVPGPIVKDTDELINVIKNNNFSIEKIDEFRAKFFEHFDGKSTQRVIEKVFN